MRRVQSKRNNQTETRDSLDTIGDFPAPRVKRVELWFPFAFFISSDDESFQFVLHIAALTLHEAIKESRKKNRQRNKKPWIFKVWNYQSEIFPWNMEYGKIGSQKNPEVLLKSPNGIWNLELRKVLQKSLNRAAERPTKDSSNAKGSNEYSTPKLILNIFQDTQKEIKIK